ncbi:DUF2891 family protein [Rhodohalobacter sp. 614A]|uniref:DUF2891 family protein n=1 Tax=Rhodohalobacter sp. 614A TaxID=2908649 RepID=UPI001F36C12D|nr:DUF2891 family protein [Rhodohalobacter sp. 614A]
MKYLQNILLLAALFVFYSCNNSDQPGTETDSVTAPDSVLTFTGSDREKIQQVMDQIPVSETPELDLVTAVSLAALPLSCIDRPQTKSNYQGYLYERTEQLKPAFEDSLSFYGCFDWHSAVNSTWTMVRTYKQFPEMAVGGLIEEKLDNHLSESSLEGELHFFKEIARGGFERPYGWAWYMFLYDEIFDWDHEKADEWSGAMKPLVEYFSENMVSYLERLDYPIRVGTHSNTAFSLKMMHDYAVNANGEPLLEAIDKHSRRFFMDDVQCPASYEPSGSDFLSPCLAEAVLMSSVLPQQEFYDWFNSFMPAPYSEGFRSLRTVPEIMFEKESPSDEENGENEDGEDTEEENDLMGAKSHLVGLAFYRAGAFNQIASVLPENDPRKELYIKLANYHAEEGFNSLYKTDYLGTHWLGTYAIYYLATTENQ